MNPTPNITTYENARDEIFNVILLYFNKLILPTAAFVVGFFLFWSIFKYFTAYGDPAKLEAAKKSLTWTIIGAVVVALAFVAVRWIMALTGATEQIKGLPSDYF